MILVKIKIMNKFIPGETYVPVSGKVFDHAEIDNAIKVARDGWWTGLGLTTCF